MRSQTLNNNTFASDPGSIRLSERKMRRFHPELYATDGINGLKNLLSPVRHWQKVRNKEHLLNGDSRAALVLSLDPLWIAAYTDELDCAAVLRFPLWLVPEYELQIASRLLTVNVYQFGQIPLSDLQNGPAAYHRYCNFTPYIADFLSEDKDRIAFRKAQISELEWERAWYMGQEYLVRNQGKTREGYPLRSHIPAR